MVLKFLSGEKLNSAYYDLPDDVAEYVGEGKNDQERHDRAVECFENGGKAPTAPASDPEPDKSPEEPTPAPPFTLDNSTRQGA